ncbi:type II secretion system protein N [Zhongshania aquimaris]|uniref:Type II secretion system protein N n=1 Tax=Zhongshania aquimaris TaxID=2857107 RepID=A0ABS6VMS1_9GAMM|nr:type II secretion system protein N [Zhongshania aquimaris]MBW2939601.1 type II secretion system protein N [Zhongshania aquimaris]
MTRRIWIFTGLLFFVACLVVATPAWIVRDILIKQQPAMAVGNVSGRVWSGELDVVQYQGITLSGISWTLRPWGIFSGLPLAIAVTEPVTGEGNIGIGSDETLHLHSVSVDGQLERLLNAMNFPSMGFDGGITLVLDEAQINADGCQSLSGTLTLNSLSGDVEGVETIAPVSAALRCENKRIVLDIDENNSAKVRGVVRISVKGHMNGQLLLTPDPGTPLFKSLTQFMGRPSNGKDFVLRL